MRQDSRRASDDRNLKCNWVLRNEINFLGRRDTRCGTRSLCKRAAYRNQQHTCYKHRSVYISRRLQRDKFRIYHSDNNFSRFDRQTNCKRRKNILQIVFHIRRIHC